MASRSTPKKGMDQGGNGHGSIPKADEEKEKRAVRSAEPASPVGANRREVARAAKRASAVMVERPSLYQNVVRQFDKAADLMGLDPDVRTILATTDQWIEGNQGGYAQMREAIQYATYQARVRSISLEQQAKRKARNFLRALPRLQPDADALPDFEQLGWGQRWRPQLPVRRQPDADGLHHHR